MIGDVIEILQVVNQAFVQKIKLTQVPATGSLTRTFDVDSNKNEEN